MGVCARAVTTHSEVPSHRFSLAHALSVRPPRLAQRVGHEQQQHQRLLGGTAGAEREDRRLRADCRRRRSASAECDGAHHHRPRQELEL